MKYPSIKSVSLLIIFLFSIVSVSSATMISPSLSDKLDIPNQDSLVTVVVILNSDSQSDQLRSQSKSTASYNRSENIKRVVKTLSSFRAPNQSNIEKFLETKSAQPIITHWIIPAYTAQLKISDLNELSQIDGVQSIVDNVQLSFDNPIKDSPAPFAASAAISNELYLMNVPSLWSKGLKGKGSLICSFDTGVDGTHPALANKWRGNHAPKAESWFSKVNPASTPFDATGHGTHTMGVMLGAMDADSFGVAPEAEWISAGVIDQGRSLSMTISDIIEAFQWGLNPDGDVETTDDVPDVILNSWGIPKGLFLPCDDTFWGVIDNVEAAGIVTIFAAGNEGPEPMSLRSPADRSTTPLNSFSVGAVNLNREVASFSSRGPSSCDPTQIKPEVVAPGVNIRSSTKGGGFAYMSGTSMAAPYVAGAVALIRQYNPNATVEQIKNAFIQSALDLGANGEDNAYGNGFVDLLTILKYIPLPVSPEYQIASYNYVGQSYILPGETFDLRLTLNNTSANVESATVVISALDNSGIQVLSNSASFFFGQGGSVAQNAVPFNLKIDSSVVHGSVQNMRAVVSSTNASTTDTIDFQMTVGIPSIGNIANHVNSKLDVTVSDFGLFGFAPGSSYNLDGDGFRFNGSNNLLYEAGLVIGRSALQMSTSIRDSNGNVKPSEFSPKISLSTSTIAANGDESRVAVFDDSHSDISIPVEVKQETTHSNAFGEEGMLLVSYTVHNNSVEQISGLYFGMLHDFDLSSNDQVSFDSTLSMIYQKNNLGMFVGVVNLKNMTSFKTYQNSTNKIGFTNTELYASLLNSQNNIDNISSGDMMFMTSTKSFNLKAHDSMVVAFAYVCGNSLNELYDNAALAKQKFDITTDVGDTYTNLPDDFNLMQNYPNPFNPTTTIQFQIPTSSNVKLEIYNVMGQKVKTLADSYHIAGTYSYEWNATDNNNQTVASGIYFYRLSNDTQYKSQKMTLLK